MRKPLQLWEVEPIGVHHDLHGHELSTYPLNEDALQLRELRVELGLPLTMAAVACGLNHVTYGALERGHYECDWEEAKRRLRGDQDPS